jgi:hypothetical protein
MISSTATTKSHTVGDRLLAATAQFDGAVGLAPVSPCPAFGAPLAACVRSAGKHSFSIPRQPAGTDRAFVGVTPICQPGRHSPASDALRSGNRFGKRGWCLRFRRERPAVQTRRPPEGSPILAHPRPDALCFFLTADALDDRQQVRGASQPVKRGHGLTHHVLIDT